MLQAMSEDIIVPPARKPLHKVVKRTAQYYTTRAAPTQMSNYKSIHYTL